MYSPRVEDDTCSDSCSARIYVRRTEMRNHGLFWATNKQAWSHGIMTPFERLQQRSRRALARSRHDLLRRRRRSATRTPVDAREQATPLGGIHKSPEMDSPVCARGISVGGATELRERHQPQSPRFGRRRDCFLSDRTCLSFSRRCFAPREGALGLRFVGAAATLNSNSASLLRQS